MEDTVSLYHCNFEEQVNSFQKTRNLIISSHEEDDKWGGEGMYFWDNLGNAKYWEKEKNKKNPDLAVSICRCQIKFDVDKDILDLTNLEAEQKFEYIIKFKSNAEKKNFADAPIGEKIDFFCDFLSVKVVKFFGKYPKTPKTTAFNSDDKFQKLTNKIKVIYCLKNQDYDLFIGNIQIIK